MSRYELATHIYCFSASLFGLIINNLFNLDFKFKKLNKPTKMSKINDQSYVTLATNDNYVIGALTLAQSLRNSNTNRLLTILITNGVSFSLQ